MCGRFLNIHPSREIARSFRVVRDLTDDGLFARWNIAPSQPIRAIREGSEGRELVALRWGLVPSWARSPDEGPRPINARAESLSSAAPFRAAFARRRCVVPASGFYEWRRAGGAKIPHAIVPDEEGGVFAFAGVWEAWGDGLETCAIVTTRPNALMAPIHDRMPAILTMDGVEEWLDAASRPERLLGILGPADERTMRVFAVSRRVNSPHNDDPSCLAPAAQETERQGELF